MTRRGTRSFFIAGTAIFGVIFIGLTIDSHRQFGALTHSDQITPAVIEGKHVWHSKNCINCHTLLGEGAYFAPDLTKIAQHRGEAYLRQFLKDPAKYYSEERNGRLMPNLNLTDEQIGDLYPSRSFRLDRSERVGTDRRSCPAERVHRSKPSLVGRRRAPRQCAGA